MDVKRYVRAQWDRVVAGGCVLLGAIALLLGWLGMSDSALSYQQLPYLISGGLVGLAVIGVGATMYLSADLRDEWRKLDTLEDKVDQALAQLETPEPPAVSQVARRRSRRATTELAS
jgi:hypothetical protein